MLVEVVVLVWLEEQMTCQTHWTDTGSNWRSREEEEESPCRRRE